MSVTVRGVRVDRVESFWRRVSVTSIHLLRGIDGKRAAASNETRISSGFMRFSLICLINSKEFLQLKGESLMRGRIRGTRKADNAS